MENYNGKYADIINMTHHVSKKHPQMSLEARAAQFAPFAALVGYDDAVIETARITSEEKYIDESELNNLDLKLKEINNENNNIDISIKYFVPDKRKSGGEYVEIIGEIKKIDEYEKKIILKNNLEIPLNKIIELEIIKNEKLQ